VPSILTPSERAGVPGTTGTPSGFRRARSHGRPASVDNLGGQAGAPARLPRRPVISTSQQHSWAYSEGFVTEDDVLVAGRSRAAEVGCVPIQPGGGAALRFLAAVLDARAVVEVGTGTGVSGVWLLRGMAPDGVLTTVEAEAEHQRLARLTFAEAGFAPGRTRTILGRALDVLPRLADSAYDLVFVDGDKREYADDVEEAYRLLRSGGVLALDNALWHDKVADPAQRDPETVAVRDVGRALAADERFVPCLLPVGDGLLVAVRR
jgi:predicted O-methyltransferase YrrM